MEHRIRYGALSTASILPRFVGGMNETENGCVEAVASRTLEKAQRTAQELGIPKAYGDYHELLQDPELDAVYIPVINSLHYSYAYNALKAGKHVVIEKPFFLHTWEAEELQELAVSNGLFLTEAIKTPFLPVYAAVASFMEMKHISSAWLNSLADWLKNVMVGQVKCTLLSFHDYSRS